MVCHFARQLHVLGVLFHDVILVLGCLRWRTLKYWQRVRHHSQHRLPLMLFLLILLLLPYFLIIGGGPGPPVFHNLLGTFGWQEGEWVAILDFSMLIHNTQTSAESTETDFRHLSFIQPVLIPRLVNLSRITACREHFALQTIYRGGGAWPLLGFRIVF